MREGGFLVFFATLLTGPAVFACGDKLMLLTAGARFRQVNSVLHPASILAYTSQNSPISGVVRELERQPALHRAGHKFVAVQDFTRLDEALKNGKYDLVLIEPSDADRLLQGIRSAPSKPLILPVLYKPTRAEATAVEKRFHCLLKAPGSLSHYLSAIDTTETPARENSAALIAAEAQCRTKCGKTSCYFSPDAPRPRGAGVAVSKR